MITYSIGLKNKFRGITVREGMLFEGPAGWAEWSPFLDYDDATCVSWLRACPMPGFAAFSRAKVISFFSSMTTTSSMLLTSKIA